MTERSDLTVIGSGRTAAGAWELLAGVASPESKITLAIREPGGRLMAQRTFGVDAPVSTWRAQFADRAGRARPSLLVGLARRDVVSVRFRASTARPLPDITFFPVPVVPGARVFILSLDDPPVGDVVAKDINGDVQVADSAEAAATFLERVALKTYGAAEAVDHTPWVFSAAVQGSTLHTGFELPDDTGTPIRAIGRTTIVTGAAPFIEMSEHFLTVEGAHVTWGQVSRGADRLIATAGDSSPASIAHVRAPDLPIDLFVASAPRTTFVSSVEAHDRNGCRLAISKEWVMPRVMARFRERARE